jgi:hypothetical protein
MWEEVEISSVVDYEAAMVQRISMIVGWLALIAITFATLSPIGLRPSVASASPHLEHFAAFCLVGLAFALGHPNRILLVVIIVASAALGLEVLQFLTPDRHARAVDAFVKALGGISGICIGQTLFFVFRLKPASSDRSI